MPIYQFPYTEYNSEQELQEIYRTLLSEARNITQNAYAPYSNFNVGCAVLLNNHKIIHGVNIENASYPVGICAERSALSAALSSYPEEKILAMAISYFAESGKNETPAFPCGMCRQFICEVENRNEKNITLILAAQTGKVIMVDNAKSLLPFSFSKNDLK